MGDVKKMLGERVRHLRTKANLSQEKMAEKMGISPKYLSQIERGNGNVCIVYLEKISTGLEISLSELFDFEHELPRKELVGKIESMIKTTDDENLKKMFRIIKSISE